MVGVRLLSLYLNYMKYRADSGVTKGDQSLTKARQHECNQRCWVEEVVKLLVQRSVTTVVSLTVWLLMYTSSSYMDMILAFSCPLITVPCLEYSI